MIRDPMFSQQEQQTKQINRNQIVEKRLPLHQPPLSGQYQPQLISRKKPPNLITNGEGGGGGNGRQVNNKGRFSLQQEKGWV